jgi:hypothetical protein
VRFPRPRFTIRLFMTALAMSTVAIILGVQTLEMLRRRADFLGAAEYHAGREREEHQKLSNVAVARSKGLGKDPLTPIIEDLARARLAYHGDMRRKWQRAAGRPWEAVPPDPDEPTDERIVKPFDLTPPPYITDTVPMISLSKP